MKTDEERSIETAQSLSELSRLDPAFREIYLRRARELLEGVFSREQYDNATGNRELFERSNRTLRQALDQRDWPRVGTLSSSLRALERRLTADHERLTLGEEIYEPTDVPISPLSLEVARITRDGPSQFREAMLRATRDLEDIEQHDPTFATQASLRLADLKALPEPTASAAAAALNPKRTADLAKKALAAHRWEELEAIAAQLHEEAPQSADECHCGPEPTRISPLEAPETTSARANSLGLEVVDLEVDPSTQSYMSCRCTIHPELTGPGFPSPGHTCGCHDRCPELDSELRLNLDLFKHRLFLTSRGARYLPRFPAERLLVECFPETQADASASSALLPALGLETRVGLTRMEIDHALVQHGPDVVDQLGLDPWRFCLACIPFDAYLRLAPRFGWGRTPSWTHLDGYQVFTGWSLRALVGGNAERGGANSYLPLSLTDDREDSIVRFAVVARSRLIDPPPARPT